MNQLQEHHHTHHALMTLKVEAHGATIEISKLLIY
jgi:hypothetical protein